MNECVEIISVMKKSFSQQLPTIQLTWYPAQVGTYPVSLFDSPARTRSNQPAANQARRNASAVPFPLVLFEALRSEKPDQRPVCPLWEKNEEKKEVSTYVGCGF